MKNLLIELENINERINNHLKLINRKGGLLDDLGGITLFKFYYGRYKNNPDDISVANSLVDIIINNIQASAYHNIKYSNGSAGLGWLLKHLKKEDFIDFESGDIFSDLDEIILEYSIKELEKGNYDFLHGAMGGLHYFLEDVPNLPSIQIICSKLDETKHQAHNKYSFWPFYNILDHTIHEETINLGLSHGQPSIVSILASVYKIFPQKNLKKLLEDAVQTVLFCKNTSGSYSIFPPRFIISQGTKNHTSRMAWCYGDPGIACSLWNAGEALNNKVLKKNALECINNSLNRKSLTANLIKDAGLCHGSAGILQIFNSFANKTNNKSIENIIPYWQGVTTELINTNTEEVPSGFSAWNEKNGYYNDFGLLQGLSGIGLALLSLADDNSFNWQRALLI
ncbi:lanthionine synthetase C family protein [Chryseobacterium luteum]|uniref:Lantibiotic biosynthesis protein n=1 Tax=Chryseobacterium luteum TaxID=421531 RepID=A0A085ZWX7_9FLAO|nr:lanthionine synthetase C family protein [Chryseobacterium luteum]KFF08941.1 hypothetical protein IX38_00025 [Chryseobacterium luteum]